ncbi:hypothetical protein Hbl1158_00455 [Halobaculum sp. CBA1158]|uniref:hypothetical protein n=1 Tax=Halobaculum sp. CBA1158 TaxID=2904243 RepID=UPI001F2973F7|nr:hypothetical protein [Halobaculum sp. CBA1158]UIO99878.1 hypothetical protein Hbl1158_00455 [Halobaculum sp. CBA1158]
MTSPDEVFRDFADSEEAQEYYDDHNRTRDEVAEENLGPLIDEFLNGEVDIVEFRNRNNGLNKQHPLWGFDGFVGGMHFNKLLKAVPDESELEQKLRDVIQPPESDAEAHETIDAFAEYTQRLKENDLDSDPFPKSTIFFLSYFWHIQQPGEWPLYYPTTEQYLKEVGLFEMEESYGASYVDFIETMDDLREEASTWLEAPVEYRDVSNAIYWHEEWDESEIEEEETSGETEERDTFVDVDKPYLPPVVADLDEVAAGTDEAVNRYAPVETDLAVVFEKKCGRLFEMLGFDTEILGQGSGRNPDGIAIAVRNDYAVIYDAKKREDGYRIGRDDRTIREYIEAHTRRLRDQGKRHIYFAIVSSSFRDTEESTLRDLRTNTDIDNIVLLKAGVLQELLRIRLEEPYLNLDDVEWVFGNRPGEIQSEELENIVPEWRQSDSEFSVS